MSRVKRIVTCNARGDYCSNAGIRSAHYQGIENQFTNSFFFAESVSPKR